MLKAENSLRGNMAVIKYSGSLKLAFSFQYVCLSDENMTEFFNFKLGGLQSQEKAIFKNSVWQLKIWRNVFSI